MAEVSCTAKYKWPGPPGLSDSIQEIYSADQEIGGIAFAVVVVLAMRPDPDDSDIWGECPEETPADCPPGVCPIAITEIGSTRSI